jgi:hypothetical protein
MKKLLVILTFLFILCAGVYVWLGGLSTVKISEQKTGSFHLLYLEHTGPYSRVYPVIQNVEKLAKENQVDYESTFGIYYDNPGLVAKEKLRSILGVIVNDKGLAKAKELLKDGKLKYRTTNEQSYAKTGFPYKNMLSIFIAINKVYPAFNQYAKDQKFPDMVYKEKDYENDFIMEIYQKNKIEYLMTLPEK